MQAAGSEPTATWLSETEPAGSVFVFIDESFRPLVAMAAVIVESQDVLRLDSEVGAEYEKLCTWYHLEGLPNFAEFRRNGFHASSDPPEVKVAFVGLLSRLLLFKSHIVFSDGSARPDLSEKKRLMVVLDSLTRDVLRAYRSRPRIVFVFESARKLDRYYERVVMRAAARIRDAECDVDVRFGTKRAPDLLAVPDYVLHIFTRWHETRERQIQEIDPRGHQDRAMRAILGSLSAARSVDDNTVTRRALD